MKQCYRGILFALAVLIFPLSCTEFFSTTLAPWAARDSASLIPPVTAGNVQDLIAQAENNPDLSLAILQRIKTAKETAKGEELSRLQAAALEAAVNATGLGSSLLSKAGEISNVVGDADKAKDLVIDAINGMSNLSEASSLLDAILPKSGDGSAAFQSFVDASSSENLAMSAAVLLAAESKKHASVNDYVENFDPNKTLTPGEQLTVNIANAALKKIETEGSGGPLGDILSGLNLVPGNLIPPAGGRNGPAS
jgi:hypothetical protein